MPSLACSPQACKLQREAERLKEEAQSAEEMLSKKDARLRDLEAKLAETQEALMEKSKSVADAIQVGPVGCCCYVEPHFGSSCGCADPFDMQTSQV